MTTTRERPSPGRPRNSDLTQRVLAVAEDLFGAKGFGPVTMAEVAAGAGVGLDTIYRRWDSKQRLLLDVVAQAATRQIPIIDRGSLEEDLVGALRGIIAFASSPAGSVLAAAIAEATHDPELASQLAAGQDARRTVSRQMIERAQERGELTDATAAELLLDLLNGLVWQRVFVSHRSFGRDEPRVVVRQLLAGFSSIP